MTLARTLRAEARALCRAQPGYGSPSYRGDPYEAVALQQHADWLEHKGYRASAAYRSNPQPSPVIH